MGENFPFEVGTISYNDAAADSDLIQMDSAGIPKIIRVFCEKSIVQELEYYDENYPLIIDYVESEKVSQIFIPIIPLPLDEYEFYR